MAGEATRYISSFIIELLSDFTCFATAKLDLDPTDLAIICLVAAESTREIRKDPYVARQFGGEKQVFPDIERPPVSVKFIHTRLGLSRETTRRRVAELVGRGLLKRGKGGVYFPAQTGDDDYTLEIRNYLVRKFDALIAVRDSLPG
ncbi:hypothetical protein CHX26_01825 [Porphyrobacter sp. HT-58-2]|uniref:DeoR family transcriptional regulator n=1 Tax=Porphyrobacter sp. HT-58-2 TaxID=2023229 RepID=UPI000CDC1D6F|nr:DeoR family transcriptional regulator [Porphyrobacter sp. HT-58-2]AUX68425.1 hypothetical protein CHX26_01825 [Porphyrobacter sp. HT-58-2]